MPAHGFGSDQNLWRLVVPALADHFGVVLFDYVGSGRSDERPEPAEELKESFCTMDPEIAQVPARTTFLSDSREDLATVTLPTLVLECAEDVIAPPEVGTFVHSAITGNRLVTLAATGHCPRLSAPRDTADALLARRPRRVVTVMTGSGDRRKQPAPPAGRRHRTGGSPRRRPRGTAARALTRCRPLSARCAVRAVAGGAAAPATAGRRPLPRSCTCSTAAAADPSATPG